jgi:hypothetical protein
MYRHPEVTRYTMAQRAREMQARVDAHQQVVQAMSGRRPGRSWTAWLSWPRRRATARRLARRITDATEA